MTYTQDDVIIWPDDPRLKNAIGKECFYADSRCIVIGIANGKYGLPYSPFEGCGILKRVDSDELTDVPFLVNGCNRSFIILKKEPQKKYVPFDLSKKEDRDALLGRRIRSCDRLRGEYDSIIVGFELEYDKWFAYSAHRKHTEVDLAVWYEYVDGLDKGKPVSKEIEE